MTPTNVVLDVAEDTTMTATQRFFTIVELVEQVLLDKTFAVENLFVLQRVNKTVQAIIHCSHSLQRKMCLAFDNKVDIKAPTQYNSVFSMRYMAPGYLGRLPYRSISNNRICDAFGTFTLVLDPHTSGGLIQIRASHPNSSTPCRVGRGCTVGSWKDMPIANVPLVAIHHYYGKGILFLRAGMQQMWDIKTLGDLHQALDSFENRMDCLELYAAARVPMGGHTAAARM